MKELIIALASPIFLLCVLFELWLSERRRQPVYHLSTALTDLACGVFSQVSVFYCQKSLQAAYAHLYENYRLFTWIDGALVWIVGFLLMELLFYWFHRLSHEVNLLWAVHIVHHQSEDMNLAAGLRQAFFTVFITWLFFLPMAFFGIPPQVFSLLHAFNLLYQFWLHTELIRSTGPLESILNTPSHHRVHHGQNPQYLDKNYSGTLIIWDKLFKTFAKEEEPVVYGITKPLASYNSLWAQYHYFVELWREAKAAPRWIDKLKVWWKGPDWSPEGLPPKRIPYGISRENFVKYTPPPPDKMRGYAVLCLVAGVLSLFALQLFGKTLGSAASALIVVSMVLLFVSLGGILERKPWALRLERFRLGFLVGATIGALWYTDWLWYGLGASMLYSALHLFYLRKSSLATVDQALGAIPEEDRDLLRR